MKHIHIIGIGGTFMGGVAAIAKEAGFKVSGCDAKMYPPMSTQLEALGIDVHEGFDAAQLDEFQADVYVIGNVAKRGMDVVEATLNPASLAMAATPPINVPPIPIMWMCFMIRPSFE